MSLIFRVLVFLIFVTSSFDIFLNVNLGGFNIRACYLFVFLFITLYLYFYKDAARIRFLGLFFFLAWVAFLLAFVWNTPLLNRNIGYLIWLGFNCMTCYVIYKFAMHSDVYRLIKLYLISFFFLSIVGILQFTLSQFGIHILVTMWWAAEKIARVNAFSYEPSYYASYLLIGFCFLYASQRKQIYYFRKKNQLLILVFLVVAIFLSTSRMGILFMILILLYDVFRMLFRVVFTRRISTVNFIVSVCLILSFSVVIGNILLDEELRSRYLAGTGLESTAAHSREVREEQLLNVWRIFLDSPVIGYSLGGIAPNIAVMEGVIPETVEETKPFEGLNVILEVLAASGIIGFIFFFFWIFQLFRGAFRLSGRLKREGFWQEGILLQSLCFALLIELVILSFSQNILRPYLWILIGLINAAYFKLRLNLKRNLEGRMPELEASPANE
jgi:hypothetical protein